MLSLIEKREWVYNTPIEIFLETSNACNLSCIFCAKQTRDTGQSGTSTIMSLDIMKSIRDFLPGMAAISLHGFGEPLLKRTVAAVSSAEYKLSVDFFTNGMLLNEKTAKALIEGQVPGFTVSISTANPERYEKFYKHGNFAKLASNLRFLKEEKQRHGTSAPRIIFNTVAMRDTLPDLPGLVSLAAELGVSSIELKPLVTYSNLEHMHEQLIQYDELRDGPILANARRIAQKSNVLLITSIYEATKPICPPHPVTSPKTEQLLPDDSLKKTKIVKAISHKPCPLVFRTMYINSKGHVKPCCFSSDDIQLSLGDVTKQTIHEIWNGDKYQELRRSHREGRVSPICTDCVKFNLAPTSDAEILDCQQRGRCLRSHYASRSDSAC